MNLYVDLMIIGFSVAIAVAPIGLRKIVAVAFTSSVREMAKKKVFVKNRQALESLSLVDVVCANKTGLLTQDTITVRKLYMAGNYLYVTGEDYAPQGKIILPQDIKWAEKNKKGLEKVFTAAALCNNATLLKTGVEVKGLFRQKDGNWDIVGNYSEGALLVFAAKGGYWRETLELSLRRVYEQPFSPKRMCMSVVYQDKKNKRDLVFSKGAPDVLLKVCRDAWWNGKVQTLNEGILAHIHAAYDEMTSSGLRVFALACNETYNISIEKDLVFLALVGMVNQPRKSAEKAIDAGRKNGIKTILVTGDDKKTAVAAAEELGIMVTENIGVLTGSEIDKFNESQLVRMIDKVGVCARVKPEHKIRILRALERKGLVVAMTGKYTEDASVLRQAHAGIYIEGNESTVAKEEAGIILKNNDFAAIIDSVIVGRSLYNKLCQTINYLFACNIGELFVVFGCVLTGFPYPLLSLQMLWLKIITDGLPVLALSLNPEVLYSAGHLLHRKSKSFFTGCVGFKEICVAARITIITLLIFLLGFKLGEGDIILARTMVVSALVFTELSYAVECSCNCNRYILGAVFISGLMQVMAVYLPCFQTVLHIAPLGFWHWLLIISLIAGAKLLQGMCGTVKIMIKRD